MWALLELTAASPAFAQAALASVLPGISTYEIAHVTLYRVHQRVAKTFRLGGVCLAGDAAHIQPVGRDGHEARLAWREPGGGTRPL
jgi:3-(3-hydroxy-phenyl)propionate hydroxylase